MLWITRKGAIEATNGQWGVIPGSMGTKSYITKVLGNPASYNSSSHGAGRRMSRSQAKKNLTQESLNEAMKGKAWNQQPAALLDEHPAAYKDIDTVMDSQKDTTRIVYTLRQVVNYKGWNQGSMPKAPTSGRLTRLPSRSGPTQPRPSALNQNATWLLSTRWHFHVKLRSYFVAVTPSSAARYGLGGLKLGKSCNWTGVIAVLRRGNVSEMGEM